MSKVRAMWMRPYKPGIEGTIANSLVSFRKHGYIQAYDKTMQANKIIQYSYWLYIDLWMVKLQISWLGKKHSEPTAPKEDS